MSLINDHTDRQIEDFSLTSPTLAAAAAESLQAMAHNRVRQAERVAGVIKELRAEIVDLETENVTLKRHIAQLTSENVALLKSRQSLSESHRRLNMCFVSLLKSVEDHCGGAVSVEQRVEATIQAKDVSLETDDDLDAVSNRMANFLGQFSRDPSLSTIKHSI
jgi:predicted  nucleic acid-binding Zn-ribbon protein